MNPSLVNQLDGFARQLVPFGVTLFLVMFETIQLPLPGSAAVAPGFSLVAIYYWTVYRPDLMPPVAVFVIGMLLDVVSGALFGVNALVMLAIYGAVLTQRRLLVGKSFNIVWFGFLFALVLTAGLDWLVHAIINGAFLDPTRLFARLGMTALLYPILAWCLGRLQRAFVRDSAA